MIPLPDGHGTIVLRTRARKARDAESDRPFGKDAQGLLQTYVPPKGVKKGKTESRESNVTRIVET